MEYDLSLMKNVIKPLAKSALIPLGLTAALPVADAKIYEKNRFRNDNIDNSKQRNKRYYKKVKALSDKG